MNFFRTDQFDTTRISLLILAVGCFLVITSSVPRSALSWISDICGATSGPIMATTLPGSGEAIRARTDNNILSCERLPNVPGKSITTMIVSFPPNAYTPAHRHPGSVTAFVLEGTVRSQMEGSPAIDYVTGQTWFEAPNALHIFAENPDQSHPAKLLAIFVNDSNCGSLVLPP